VLLKHRQGGFWEEGNLCVHGVTHSVRILTDGSGETASTPKIVSDVARSSARRCERYDGSAHAASTSAQMRKQGRSGRGCICHRRAEDDVTGGSLGGSTDKTMRPHVGGLIARASLPAALHQAPGGWRPAPLYSWPKGWRPFRESPRRHPDPWWPLQTSTRLPLAPLDIFYPAQSGSPLLPVTISRSRYDYALRWNPFRGNCTKVNLRRGLCPDGHATACGVSLHEASVLTRRQSSPRSFPVSLWMK
jgi:hypothetical protein